MKLMHVPLSTSLMPARAGRLITTVGPGHHRLTQWVRPFDATAIGATHPEYLQTECT
jgi:hypothetical protein